MLDQETFDHFYSEGTIVRTIRPVKRGKEARVVLCEAGPSVGHRLVAIKEYAPIEQRTFRGDDVYLDAQVRHIKDRDRRAVRKKTAHGLAVKEALWQGREWEHLSVLHEAGAAVPEPIAQGPRSICMEFIGDEEQAAPQLHRVRLDRTEARSALDQIMAIVETMLRCNLIHADLSAFNVLWWAQRPVVIDLPQAIDPRAVRNAEALLTRDVENVCKHFERYGLRNDADNLVRGLWLAFMFADL